MRHGRKKESKPLPTRPVPTNLTTSPRVHGGRAGAGGVVAVRTPKDRIESTVRFFAARRDAWCKHSLLLVQKNPKTKSQFGTQVQKCSKNWKTHTDWWLLTLDFLEYSEYPFVLEVEFEYSRYFNTAVSKTYMYR